MPTKKKKPTTTDRQAKPKPRPNQRAVVRRSKIAKGVVEGKSEREIAAELGMSRNGVRDAKAHPETRDLIAQMGEELSKEISRNNKRMIETIYRGMLAKTPRGQHDHSTQQRAVKNQIGLLNTIRPKKDIPIVATITLEELERRVKEGT